VVERANNVKYGLCATVWSSDVNKAHRVARKLEVSVENSRLTTSPNVSQPSTLLSVAILRIRAGQTSAEGVRIDRRADGLHAVWERFTPAHTKVFWLWSL